MNTRLRQLTARQHALVTRAQLYAHGLSDDAIRHLLRSERLERVHPGVYRLVGSPATWHQSLLAACMALGERGVASHRSAAHLWGLSGPFGGEIEVTGERSDKSRPKGATIHRSTDLAPDHVTHRHGIPVTKPARTLVDLGAVVRRKVLDRAIDDALAKRLVTIDGILEFLDVVGRRGRRGVGPCRASLAERSDGPESVLEAELERLIRRSDLPVPIFQYELRDSMGRFVARLDAGYERLRVAIEADGAATRVGRDALDYDTDRQNQIDACGWDILRFTWKQIVGEPVKTTAMIRQKLERRRNELGLSTAA